jgi:ionotropic glutamate receptor
MGRIVLVAWFFVIGILQSCYTANLSAILTAPRLEPTLNDISSVVASNLRIGYHWQSQVEDGFVEHYGVSKHRLVPLRKDEYYNALSRGHVGAIVDERPYMQSLVAKHCNRLAFAGQTFTIQNWGFVCDYYWDL